jgi:Cu/Zn superoxide dismutase
MAEPAPPPPTPEPTAATEPVEPMPAPAPEALPPPPKQFMAQVELAPIKGLKMKSVTIKLTQEEGKTATVSEAEIEGLKPGKYQLVVHESAECGANGTKAGKVFEQTAAMPIAVEVTKDAPGKIESADVAVKLDGDQSIVGKTLVLHEDKAGKPGKVVACGAIAQIEMPNEPQAAK